VGPVAQARPVGDLPGPAPAGAFISPAFEGFLGGSRQGRGIPGGYLAVRV
jgi:hypothetical protein